MNTIRGFLSESISMIVATADLHDATIRADDTYVCPAPCKFTGSAVEWQQHLADALADKLEPAEVSV